MLQDYDDHRRRRPILDAACSCSFQLEYTPAQQEVSPKLLRYVVDLDLEGTLLYAFRAFEMEAQMNIDEWGGGRCSHRNVERLYRHLLIWLCRRKV